MARERILIAEDNEKNLKLFRDVLQVNGFETLEATTGEDAIELATQNDPILILMDIRLAGMDGVAALHRLREDERTASIPVVALTAQAMAGDRERFLETGFDDYISKPVDVREFLAVVQRYCEGQGDG
jgi:two-component system, cell cycle response regulator DivK